jgi:hypothetical protein
MHRGNKNVGAQPDESGAPVIVALNLSPSGRLVSTNL